jgi:hypothetical protein
MIDKGHFIEVLEALHTNQFKTLQAFKRLEHLLDGWDWLAGGSRGCYEWDDEEYYQEIGRCLDALRDEIAKSLQMTNDSHELCCGKYRSVARHPKVPTQRRLRFGQFYNETVDELMDLALLDESEEE